MIFFPFIDLIVIGNIFFLLLIILILFVIIIIVIIYNYEKKIKNLIMAIKINNKKIEKYKKD